MVQDKRGFHLGTVNNIQEIFGDRRLLWFFPVQTCLGDGIVFPQRGSYLDNDEEMGCTDTTGLSRFADSCSQSRGARSMANGLISGHLRQHNYPHHNDIQGSINRSGRPAGTNEELVPMINATNFDDDESEDEFCWTDESNQRTKYAQKLRPKNSNSEDATLSECKSDFDRHSSNSSSTDNTGNGDFLIFEKPAENPAVIDIEHIERKNNLTAGCENECDGTAVNIRASPRFNDSSREGQDNKDNINTPTGSGTVAVTL